MSFFINTIKGIAIGAGAILPGISSGVLCVIFGIYEKLLDSVLNFFKDIRKNLKFLFPIILGVLIGILLFSNILNYVLYDYPIQTKSIFIGLILGTIPNLIKEVNQKSRFKKSNIIFLVIALFIGLATVILENALVINSIENYNFIYFMIAGFIMAVGIIVPGVSSTIILMLLGVYSVYLNSVSIMYFPVLIPMGIGLLLGSMLWMKITKILLERFYAPTFYSIIGFTLGSIFILIPPIANIFQLVICCLCIFLGIILT